MSLSSVRLALESFATATENRAIVLKGPWGTGKTYLWKTVVRQKKEKFHLPKYCYVSLFGINSLAELKREIFENSVAKVAADTPITLEGLANNLDTLKAKATTAGKKLSSQIGELSSSFMRGLGPTIDSVQFALVSNTLICIDDFERKGSSLSDKDVLGLISLLVETRDCRVVMVLNDKTVKPEAEFFSYNEKVFSYEISYNPTPVDSILLVFKSTDDSELKLAENCVALEINNIRLLKKIELFYNMLKPSMQNWDYDVTHQALHVLPLAVLAIYGADSLADIEIISNPERFHTILPDVNDSLSETEIAAQNLMLSKLEFLKDYGFLQCDEFHTSIINLVKNGYEDKLHIDEVVNTLHQKLEFERNNAEVSAAWNLFKYSFDANYEEIFVAFEKALSISLKRFSLSRLDSISIVYEVLDKEDVYRKHVDNFFEHVSVVGCLDFDENHDKPPMHPYVASSFDKYKSSKLIKKPLLQVLSQWPDYGAVNPSDIYSLSQSTVEEYKDYFRSLKDHSSSHIINKILKIGGRYGIEDEFVELYAKTLVNSYQALLDLGSESKLNDMRVARFREFASKFTGAKKFLEGLSESRIGGE